MPDSQFVLRSVSAKTTTTVVVDARGGAILEYRSSGPQGPINWLQPAGGQFPACFPMVPFCSRVRRGRFRFGGRQVALPVNDPPHAIHGHGFSRVWQIARADRSSIDLAYEHAPDAWPWRYRARQRFTLQHRRLEIRLNVENLSGATMPCGVGLHPFFPKHDCARLHAPVGRLLRLDDQALPAGVQALPAGLDPNVGLDVAQRSLDHVFVGWDGQFELDWPALGTGLRVRASAPTKNLIVWAPPGQPFVCVEPVTNLPDGFNTADHGYEAYQTLPAGATLELTCVLDPQTG